MSEQARKEALRALEQVFPSTLATLRDEFDSHEFILKLANRNQRLYVQALATYADAVHPFDALHSQIVRRLIGTGSVKKVREHNSPDIFRQVNSSWVLHKQ